MDPPCKFKYRHVSHMVAIVDLVLSVFGVIGCGGLIFLATYITINGKEDVRWLDTYAPGSTYAGDALWPFWSIVVLDAILTFVDFIAAIRLFQATKIDIDPEDALGKARFWRNVLLINIFLLGLTYSVLMKWIVTVITLVILGLLMYPVWHYIDELEEAVNGNCESESGTTCVSIESLDKV